MSTVTQLLIMLAVALASTPVQAQSARARGEALLTANCSRCHAVGRTGASAHAEAPPFRTLSQRYPIDGLAEALAEGLFVGHEDMPEFVFESSEVGAILDYLRSIQER
jgi:mono/diheme cytochrome c family protein